MPLPFLPLSLPLLLSLLLSLSLFLSVVFLHSGVDGLRSNVATAAVHFQVPELAPECTAVDPDVVIQVPPFMSYK
jgi:hypothetical protein